MFGFAIAIIVLFSLSLSAWYGTKDFVYCIVSSAGNNDVNGYYAALGTSYTKRGKTGLWFIPDVFKILALRKDTSSDVSLSLSNKNSWVIKMVDADQWLYMSTPSDPSQYIYSPPKNGWKVVDKGVSPSPIVTCHGTLQTSPQESQNQHHSNYLQQLYYRPVTTALLIIIGYYYYRLWKNGIDPNEIAFSYESIVLRGEYHRIITASLGHFEPWHLAFNVLALYQLGDLEYTYGSVEFAYLNMDLIVLTIYQQEIYLYQQSVGFSCVLFAWMVAASVRMDAFCPLFFLPSLCLPTFTIFYLPINLGPIVLVIATKFLLPRSSLIGHLSGILIGYPLAWKALNWLTPPVVYSLFAMGVIYQGWLLPWTFKGYDKEPPAWKDLAPAAQIRKYSILYTFLWPLVILSAVAGLVYGPVLAIYRLVMGFLAWSTVPARRLEWMADNKETHDQCIHLLGLSAIGMGGAALYDACNLYSALASTDLLVACGMSHSFLLFIKVLLIWLVIAEVFYFAGVVMCLNDIPICAPALSKVRLDEASLLRDFHTMGLTSIIEKIMGKIPGSLEEQLGVFEGEQNRMANGSTTAGGEEKESTPLLLSTSSSTTTSGTANAVTRPGIYPSTTTVDSNKL